jgi:hypothetical protein
MIIEAQIGTKPAPGVIATKPTTAPVAAPYMGAYIFITIGYCWLITPEPFLFIKLLFYYF